MADYQKKENKFSSRGICLSKPPDLLDESQYPYLLNMRQFIQGVLSQRPGIARVNSSAIADLNVHSIIRLNNSLPSASQAFARYLGAGSALYSDNSAHTAFTSRATGFSGLPLQFVVMRPEESPEPWLYVGDGSKSGKGRVNGTFYNHGIAPPVIAPYAQPAATSNKVIDDFEAVGSWANGGTAGAISLQTRISTTISKIVYDGSAPNWATVQPTTLDEAIQPGMLLIVNAAETVLVESVSEAVTNTTISSIQYDSGSTGPCTIQLAAPTDGLGRDSMLRLDSGGGGDEVVRVLSVTPGPGGLPSFRCSTVNTQSATKTVTGVRSFRAYFANSHSAGETLTSGNLRSSIGAGTGYISLTGTLDLSVVNSRPITDEDEIHISIKLDDVTLLTEGRVAFDVDNGTNDFTQNYFYKPFRANDLAPATTGSITTLAAQQRIIQRGQIDTSFSPQLFAHILRAQGSDSLSMDTPVLPTGSGDTSMIDNSISTDPTTQTTLGASQWTELRFKVKDLIRVGSDTSRSLHDVAAIRIQLQVTGTVQLDADAWWIGGTFGGDTLPDVGVGANYNYRFVYRSSLTGAQSNPSPRMREGIEVRRQQVNGTVTASSDAQVDQIDIYRTGGALITSDNSPPWFYVMSVPNSAPTFVDIYPDDVAIRNRQLDFDNFQPFLDLDIPRSGVCSVVGTEVAKVSGDSFNTLWPAGTIIVINNVPYTLYVQPSSTTKLSLNENAGTQTSVNWFITSPRLMAQPLPAMWGPFGGGLFEPVMFSCGSQYQTGHVFWTTSGAPDSNSQYGSLELTNPSEPLINGCVFRSQAYVFSSEALYVLQPTVTPTTGQLRFSGAKVAGNRGLFSRYAICVGDEGIFYLSRDGVYLTAGSESISLTDELLYPLFPHEGVTAVATNGIVPPDFSQPQNLRLSYCESELYFDFIDTSGHRATLLYDIKLKGWFYYSYTPSILVHYLEEGSGLNSILMGGSDGRLYISSGTDDAGTAISCAAWTPWFDAGDPRVKKQWGDGLLDWASAGAVDIRTDNDSASLGTFSTIAGSRHQDILDFTQSLHKNVNLRITNTAGSQLTLYGYDFTYIVKPETTIGRDTDWDNLGTPKSKYLQGCRIHCDTSKVNRTIHLYADNADTGIALTVNADGEQILPFSWTPFIVHLIRLVPEDSDEWRFFSYDFVYDIVPELTNVWQPDNSSLAFPEYGHCYYAYIKHISTTDITLTVIIDNVSYPYTILASGGVPMKDRIVLQPIKGKLFQFRLTSPQPFRLYHDQSIVYGKPWRSSGEYLPLQPFGETSAQAGAII